MSYILDALKKTEHEKARKQRGAGVVNISGELFEERGAQQSEARPWYRVALLVAVAAVITFGITWKLLSPGKQPSVAVRPLPPQQAVPNESPLASTAAPQSSGAVQPVPAAPMSAIAPQRQTQPMPPLPSNVPTGVAARVVPSQVPQLAEKKSGAPPRAASLPMPSSEMDAATLLTQQELNRRLRERKGNGAALTLVAPPADIKLSGIAFQDERRARRAVVNGFLLHEGSQVSGAVITDIFQDRVRFTQGGRNFELSLVATGAK